MDIKVKVRDRILKPVAEVFEAITNPEKLSRYFTSEPSGPMMTDAHLDWNFDDVGMVVPIVIDDIKFNEHIRFHWKVTGEKTHVDIHLKQASVLHTDIIITEESWTMDKAGVKAAMQQTQGWTDFICSLKAWLQAEIRIREGRVSHAMLETE